jgi:hypothetical protein
MSGHLERAGSRARATQAELAPSTIFALSVELGFFGRNRTSCDASARPLLRARHKLLVGAKSHFSNRGYSMTKYLAPLSLILCLSSSAFAAWSTTTTVKISEVEITSASSGSTTYLSFSTMPDKRPSCATSSQAIITGTAEHMRMMTNLAMAAYVSGKRVRVYWNNQCTSTFGQVTRLLVE